MSARTRTLSAEDRILWNRVARTTAPLPGKTVDAQAFEAENFSFLFEASGAEAGRRTVHPQPAGPKQPAAQHHGIDGPTRDKLARGRLPLDGRVDLHGLTQREAHALLITFLRRAHAAGLRHVLVVTGKGSSPGSDGILRRAVPAWLSTPPLSALVGAQESAARRHGGDGALYVRLRRGGGRP